MLQQRAPWIQLLFAGLSVFQRGSNVKGWRECGWLSRGGFEFAREESRIWIRAISVGGREGSIFSWTLLYLEASSRGQGMERRKTMIVLCFYIETVNSCHLPLPLEVEVIPLNRGFQMTIFSSLILNIARVLRDWSSVGNSQYFVRSSLEDVGRGFFFSGIVIMVALSGFKYILPVTNMVHTRKYQVLQSCKRHAPFSIINLGRI